MQRTKQAISNLQSKLFVLFFLIMLNFITTGGHFDSHDGIFYFLVAENVVLNHSIKIDPDSPSVKTLEFEKIIENFVKIWIPKVYDSYQDNKKIPFFMPGGILGPLLAVPAYMLASITGTEPTNIVPFFTNSIIIALTSFMIFLITNNLLRSYRIGLILALVFNFTSFIWPYNTSFFLQPALSLSLIASIYFITDEAKMKRTKNFVFSGILIGLSVLIHPSALILIPGFMIFIIVKSRNWKKAGIFIGVSALISTTQLIVNFLKYDSVSSFGYDSIQIVSTHSNLDGLLGLLFSPGWGILFYFPLALLLPFALRNMYREQRMFVFLTLYVFFTIWIFFGTEPTPHWSGFGAWGPRYFIPFLPLSVISLGYLFRNLDHIRKILFITLCILGFFVNILGKLVWYMTGYGYGWGIEKLLEREDSFNYFAWSPYYSPILEHLKVLLTNYGHDTINPITRKSGCAVDIFVYCTGGIIPFILMLLLTSIIGYICCKKFIKKEITIDGS